MDAPPSDYSLWKWSSADAPTGARLFAWRDLVCRKLLKLQVEPLSNEPFRVDVYLRALTGLRFAWGLVDASRNLRTRAMVEEDNDDFIFMMNIDDELVVSQNGRRITLGPGEACLSTCTETASYNRAIAGRLLCLRLTRDHLASRVPDIFERCMKKIPAETAALRLLTRYIGVLDSNQALAAPDIRELIVSHIYDLTALVLNPVREATAPVESGGLGAARLRAVKAFIAKNLSNRELSVSFVAEQNRVTTRYIQKLLEREGVTFSEYVMEERLAQVFNCLSNPRLRNKPISAIALDHGFGDVSHFNHVFRRRYGTSPSDIRNRDVLTLEP